ncbi:MAG: HU family DNA-binding protein [Holosporaceae bacterium]|jgi:DNA-binding protein HU-beta|nr:HU family DNA-binding protein [Holosporaceae bacterium]
MNKTDLIKSVSEKAGLTIKDTALFLDAFIKTAEKTLSKKEDIVLVGFGTFSVTERSARMGRNFKTGKSIKVPASKSVKFKPGKTLKDLVK